MRESLKKKKKGPQQPGLNIPTHLEAEKPEEDSRFWKPAESQLEGTLIPESLHGREYPVARVYYTPWLVTRVQDVSLCCGKLLRLRLLRSSALYDI